MFEEQRHSKRCERQSLFNIVQVLERSPKAYAIGRKLSDSTKCGSIGLPGVWVEIVGFLFAFTPRGLLCLLPYDAFVDDAKRVVVQHVSVTVVRREPLRFETLRWTKMRRIA